MKYLFLLVINNGGSSVLYEYLSQCKDVNYLRREGQSYSGMLHSWDMDADRCFSVIKDEIKNLNNYDWNKVKSSWLKEWKRCNHYNQENNNQVFLQKSPPDLFRAEMLQEHFPNSYFIIMNRNPYAVAEGIRRKGGWYLEEGIKHWVESSKEQIKNMKRLDNYIYFSYEDLCDNANNTKDIENKIRNFLPELDDLDLSQSKLIQTMWQKETEVILKNKNEEQIKRLSRKDITTINECLKPVESLLNYFDYKLIGGGK